MEYENMRMPELKAIARERRLRNYSRMRKAELVELLRNNPLAMQPGILRYREAGVLGPQFNRPGKCLGNL